MKKFLKDFVMSIVTNFSLLLAICLCVGVMVLSVSVVAFMLKTSPWSLLLALGMVSVAITTMMFTGDHLKILAQRRRWEKGQRGRRQDD